MIDIEGPQFKSDNDGIKKQIANIRRSFNETWEEWDTRKVAIESLVRFYVGEDVSVAWRIMGQSIDNYFDCIYAPTNRGSDNQCTEKREVFLSNLKHLQDIWTPTIRTLNKEIIEEIRRSTEGE